MRAPIAVLGLGGIGGMIAARTDALCIGTERVVDAIAGKGLTLVQGDRTLVVHPEVATRLDRPVSLLVVAVKAHALESALERLEPSALAGAIVLPLINGLEHVDGIRARLQGSETASHGRPEVAAGSIGRVEAFSPEPGLVVQRTRADAILRAASRDVDPDVLDASLDPLRVTGIDVVVGDDEPVVLWEKTARLAVLAAATVATDATVGRLREDMAWRERMRRALEESCRVAAADGAEVDPTEQWAIIESLPADLITSTARDAAAGRPTELDAIAGSVVRAGWRHGIRTPVLEELLSDAQARVGP